ncbi:MAG TPA: L-aspartate oxidase [Gammaproteobacteria bacterium]|nr:L-aspartate oxidase [Gammaproteobacteria bacterium]MEC8010896.1 L-aspartate oxidase [Pseudomonadota bacterium]HBF06793.1 L-aspartate oxidase [Gammaproteobacteria bacterium]HCK91490.1 L-aspartate oxidase [Gammaproteobacteria bacterium]|tara:strand:+ start:23898 stop:25580 length:1683 start_codon:yes stop_codon:yes gene_type:complete
MTGITQLNTNSNLDQSSHQCDVLIIGSGAAGLSCALKLPEHLSVVILSKADITEASTFYAQGGIAAVIDDTDSLDAHVQDTLICGGGLCKEDVVQAIVESGPGIIQWLDELGVPFTRNTATPGTSVSNDLSSLHLTQEGGHSHRRIIHAADATGVAIWQVLAKTVQTRKNIKLLSHRTAVDLIRAKPITGQKDDHCCGAYVYNQAENHVETVKANAVVLATGGASKTYLYTSNPEVATGDGIAMAWRAKCRVANMEFMQFHPTSLFHPKMRSFLISEAVRGEGGHLLLPNGERFMHRFHPQLELAPRDVVARAIDHEMKRLGVDCLYLDITHRGEDFIKSHFPMIYKKCLEVDLDITKEPIPVVPAAHYTCGGVVTDLAGSTDLPGLYAIGETASTGLHGANRMASNSLLECFALAFSAAKDIASQYEAETLPALKAKNFKLPAWDESQVDDSDENVVITHNWHELRRLMWDYVGIVRTDKRLARAARRIQLLQQEIQEYYSHYKVSNDLLELRNLVTVAQLIVECAKLRKESRGLHFTTDYPQELEEAFDSILIPTEKL